MDQMTTSIRIQKKRRLWTEAEKKELCKRWKASGKIKSQFCKEQELTLSTFCKWCYKLWPETLKHTVSTSSPVKAVYPKDVASFQNKTHYLSPIKIVNKKECIQHEEEAQTPIEIFYADQSVIRFRLSLKNLMTLIQELSHAATTLRQ